MSTIIRYNGHPDGYMDFYMGEELVLCENTISTLTAQQLWDAITNVEDDQLAFSFEGIATADGKTPFVDTVLNVILLRAWRIGSEKTSGSFEVLDGNVVSETNGRDIFEQNTLITMSNQLSQYGVTTGGGLTAQNISDIAQAVWDEVL